MRTIALGITFLAAIAWAQGKMTHQIPFKMVLLFYFLKNIYF